VIISDKPEGAKLGWRVLDRSYPFSTPWIRLCQDHVSIEGRGETTYTYHQSRGSVCIVPVTQNGEIILIRQYRYPVDTWCLEVPAGGLTSVEGGVSMEELALEELREEVGAICEEIKYVNSFYPANALSEEICYVYLALHVEMKQEQELESSEFIEICPTSVRDAVRLARTGYIKDAFSALSILLCEDLFREYGYI
jgi:ADP-ribose pyrophosphatase